MTDPNLRCTTCGFEAATTRGLKVHRGVHKRKNEPDPGSSPSPAPTSPRSVADLVDVAARIQVRRFDDDKELGLAQLELEVTDADELHLSTADGDVDAFVSVTALRRALAIVTGRNV